MCRPTALPGASNLSTKVLGLLGRGSSVVLGDPRYLATTFTHYLTHVLLAGATGPKAESLRRTGDNGKDERGTEGAS